MKGWILPPYGGHFSEGVDFAYWSCIRKGLRLQPAEQACYYLRYQSILLLINGRLLELNEGEYCTILKTMANIFPLARWISVSEILA